MTEKPSYTEYHPKWYRHKMSTYWWTHKAAYFAFILREISSVFVAWAVFYLLMFVRAVGRGEDYYHGFLTSWSMRPFILTMNVISLFFVIYHAVTWFNLAPQAIAVRMGGKRVPGSLIAGSNYALWAVVSVAVAWILLGV